MNDLARILDAYAQARSRNRPCALATITAVEGSSYRQVGARMLVADDGAWIGCVSGGCLERDLLRKAAWAMERGAPLLATYDTREDTDHPSPTTGAGLGCNGVIDILVEPIAAGAGHAVLDRILAWRSQRGPGGVLMWPHDPARPPVCWDGDAPMVPSSIPPALHADLHHAWSRISARGGAVNLAGRTAVKRDDVYLEAIQPPLHVVVLGAGHDAVAMAALGVHLGHEVIVVDFRSGLPVPRQAFAGVRQYIPCAPSALASHLTLDRRSVVILMTHQAQDDLAVLPDILAAKPAYVGLLGPRKRTLRLLESCGSAAAINDDNLHAPIGLDIGAESPMEIALAVFAEIQAHLRGRGGGPLRKQPGPIHDRNPDGRPRAVDAASSAAVSLTGCPR